MRVSCTRLMYVLTDPSGMFDINIKLCELSDKLLSKSHSNNVSLT